MCVQRICSVPPMQPYIWVLVKSCPITASVLLDADSLGVLFCMEVPCFWHQILSTVYTSFVDVC